jgi:RNA polymerase sigma-70 factor (ECF subfamily)
MAARISTDAYDDGLERGLRRFAEALGFNAAEVAGAVECGMRRVRSLQATSNVTGGSLDARTIAYGVIAKGFLIHAADQQRTTGRFRAKLAPAPEPQSLRPSEPERVRAALANLPPQERALLLLVALERLSYAQAAEALGIGRYELVTTLACARAHLAILLDPASARPTCSGRPQLRVVK